MISIYHYITCFETRLESKIQKEPTIYLHKFWIKSKFTTNVPYMIKKTYIS